MIRAKGWTIGNTKDANLDEYYNSANSLKKLYFDVIIPGHGKIGGTELIEHTLNLAKKDQRKKTL